MFPEKAIKWRNKSEVEEIEKRFPVSKEILCRVPRQAAVSVFEATEIGILAGQICLNSAELELEMRRRIADNVELKTKIEFGLKIEFERLSKHSQQQRCSVTIRNRRNELRAEALSRHSTN